MKSDSSTSSQESEDSDLDSKERIKEWVFREDQVFARQGDKYGSTVQEHVYHKEDSIVTALGTKHTPKVILNVLGRSTTIDTQTKSTPSISENQDIIQVTLEESEQGIFPTSISFVRDFLANPFRWLVRGRVSKILVERYSSRYVELRKLKDLICFSLRTSKDSSLTMKDLRSRSSSNRWRNWGIGLNGKFLTANILEFPKIGKECSLLDILEEEVPDRYFLSQKQMKWIKEAMKNSKNSLALRSTQTIGKDQTNTDNEPLSELASPTHTTLMKEGE